MNASFGIDHPLIAVHDINLMRERMLALGFNMTAIGQHPWGTSTSLAMFDQCLIEIMSIYDTALLDEVPAGDFRFGRHVYKHLMQREGIALTALHSTDSQADARLALEAGFDVAGHLEFGRDVVLPDARRGRTKTTLALIPDTRWPRLSFFLCQQHRPELVYVTEWLEHPNSVHGIHGITILSSPNGQSELVKKLGGLYGKAVTVNGGYRLETANGYLQILSEEASCRQLGKLPNAVTSDTLPGIVGMDLLYADRECLHQHLIDSELKFDENNGVFRLLDASVTGNVVFRFFPDAIAATSPG
ncbi:MAG: VOC family protein [Granulosicoccus sp.]